MNEWSTHQREGADFAMNHGPGRGSHCVECGAAVPTGSKFCPGCGSRTQEVCFACGVISSAGSKFCGDCGADLVDGLETQVTLREEKLSEAREAIEALDYQRAVELLLPITGAKHPILARYSADALELLDQIKTAKAEKEEEAESHCLKAEGARERLEYHEAFRLLEAVAPPFRTEAIEEARDELRPIVDEIDSLAEAIADRSDGTNSPELMAKVERLLEIQPDHARAKETGEKFRDFAHRRAEERLSQDEHDRAAEVLRLVPKTVATAQTADLLHRAHEFGSLRWDLFHAPMVDRTLVEVARRLHDIAPENANFKEHFERLSRFADKFPGDRDLAPAEWAPPPEETPWDCAVDWLTGFGETEMADTVDQSVVDRFAGSFFPAFGLALQGLGKATIDIEFLKAGKRRQARSAWGLDLSAGGLKAVRLDVRKADQAIVVGVCELIEHRKPLGQATGPDERKQLIAETLAVFRERGHKRLDNVCACLPDTPTISRHVKMPPTDAEKLAQVMEHEAQSQLAKLPDDLKWGYHTMEAVDEAAPHRERQVLLVALRESSLAGSLEVLRAAKLKVDQIQVDWLGLANALIHLGHLQPPQSMVSTSSQAATAVLDIGAETSTLLIQRPGMLDVRPIRSGGHTFTRALAHEFGLSLSDAETLKRDPRSLELLSRFHETLRPAMDDIVRDTRTGLSAMAPDASCLDIARLLTVGGGMRLHGLWRYLLYER